MVIRRRFLQEEKREKPLCDRYFGGQDDGKLRNRLRDVSGVFFIAFVTVKRFIRDGRTQEHIRRGGGLEGLISPEMSVK